MKCNNFPILWRIFLLKIANNRDYVYYFCSRPLNKLHRHCREWYLFNLVKNNSDGDENGIKMVDDCMNN